MPAATSSVGLFLAGDFMCARGIDQILPHPGDPRLYEDYLKDAGDYVRLAERCNGPIPRPVDYAYPWGVALEELRRRQPDLRLINLETALTNRGQPQPKGINYRMNPANLPLLAAAGINCCALANNHVLDWGEQGLLDTLHALVEHNLRYSGAGLQRASAEAPAIVPLANGRRLLVFAVGTPDCGIAEDWAATEQRPGVALLPDLSAHTLRALALRILAQKQPGDLLVVSIHWGGNWGFKVSREQINFAHGLVDSAGIHVLHGHSSHHIKGIEVYRQSLLLYGCGDLLDDYEGIQGYAPYRCDLGLLYFVELAADGRLQALNMLPTRQQRLSLQHAEGVDRQWLLATLSRECARFGCSVQPLGERDFSLVWSRS